MAYCPRCGAKLSDNELFCGICGTKVNDENLVDKTVGSEEDDTESIEDIQSPAKSINYNATISIVNVINSMLIKPITSINRFVDRIDRKGTIILSLVLATLQGLFAIWSFREMFLIIDKTFSNILSEFSDISIYELGESVKIPFGRIFAHGFIAYFIAVAVLYLGIYFIFNLIHKAQIPSLKLNKAIILSTIPILGGELLFLITSYINVTLALSVLLVGILVFFSTLLYSMKKLTNVSENILLYNIAAIFTVMLLCFVFASLKFLILDIKSLSIDEFLR